jgi:hypothetical protein
MTSDVVLVDPDRVAAAMLGALRLTIVAVAVLPLALSPASASAFAFVRRH